MIEQAAAAIRKSRSVVVTSHIQPDGDALGSTLGMLRALRILGKEVRAISPSHVPSGFTFMLQSEDEVVRYDPVRDDPILEAADLFLVAGDGMTTDAGVACIDEYRGHKQMIFLGPSTAGVSNLLNLEHWCPYGR